MKTKFSPVVKIKKQALDTIENKLRLARLNLEDLKKLLEQTTELALNQQFPKNGNAADIQIVISQYKIIQDDIARLHEDIQLQEKQIKHLEHQYKNAHIDLEKIKYLESEELKKHVEKLKKQEGLMLDEIATQRHFFLKETK